VTGPTVVGLTLSVGDLLVGLADGPRVGDTVFGDAVGSTLGTRVGEGVD